MKLAILAGVVALVAASAVSNAGIIVTATNAGTVDGYTDWVFHITGWTGSDVGAPGDGVNLLDGQFSVSGGGVISAPGTSNANAGSKMTNNGSGGAVSPPDSYVNFDLITASSVDPGNYRTASIATPATIQATWFTSMNANNPPDARLAPTQEPNNPGPGNGINGTNWDSTLLGEIFATPGDVVSFSGNVGTKEGTQHQTFSTPVPEPASLGLLVLGAGGLLARRRK